MAYYETFQEVWIVYLAASIGLYFVVSKISKYWVNEERKGYFRMVSAVILFTPATHSIYGTKALAPAFIVMFGELLTNGPKAAMAGLIPLLFALLVGAIALATQAYIRVRRLEKARAK